MRSAKWANLMVVAFGIWTFPLLPCCDGSIGSGDLPADGGTLEVTENGSLVIGPADTAYLNGTILVRGDGSGPVLLEIRNLGELNIGSGLVSCANASLVLNSSGTIAGGSLALESLPGGSLTLANLGAMSLEGIEISSSPASTMVWSDAVGARTILGDFRISNRNGTSILGARGLWQVETLSVTDSGSLGKLSMLLAGMLDIGAVTFEANWAKPSYLMSGRCNIGDLAANASNGAVLSLQISGDAAADLLAFRVGADSFLNLDVGGNLSAKSLSFLGEGGLLTLRNTGALSADDWNLTASGGMIHIFNWGEMSASAMVLQADGSGASLNAWLSPESVLQAGEMVVLATDGAEIEIQSSGNASLGRMEVSGAVSLRNDGCLAIDDLHATDRASVANYGSLRVELMRLVSGRFDEVLLSNRGNLSVQTADIDLFCPGNWSMVTLDCGGETRFTNLDLFSNFVVPIGKEAEGWGLINVSCTPGAEFEIENLNGGTAGAGHVRLAFGCNALVGSADLWGNADIFCGGTVQVSELSASGESGPLELSPGQSLRFGEVDLVALPGGSLLAGIPEGGLLPVLLQLVGGGVALILRRRVAAKVRDVTDPA